MIDIKVSHQGASINNGMFDRGYNNKMAITYSTYHLDNTDIKINNSENTEKTVDQVINSIFEHSEDAVFGVDSDGNIGYWNQHCIDLFGFPKNISIKGKHCSDLLCGGDKMCASQCCAQCAISENIESEKQISDFQLKIKQVEGSQVTVNIGTCYFYQDDRHKTSTYFSIREIDLVD